jgi:hypothetical protein
MKKYYVYGDYGICGTKKQVETVISKAKFEMRNRIKLDRLSAAMDEIIGDEKCNPGLKPADVFVHGETMLPVPTRKMREKLSLFPSIAIDLLNLGGNSYWCQGLKPKPSQSQARARVNGPAEEDLLLNWLRPFVNVIQPVEQRFESSFSRKTKPCFIGTETTMETTTMLSLSGPRTYFEPLVAERLDVRGGFLYYVLLNDLIHIACFGAHNGTINTGTIDINVQEPAYGQPLSPQIEMAMRTASEISKKLEALLGEDVLKRR